MKPNGSLQQDLTKIESAPNSLLKRTLQELTAYSESPYLDSLVLLSHYSGLTKSKLLANPDPTLSSDILDELEKALIQIKTGTPLPYVLGKWEFYQYLFTITPEVLIPRPETEGLVDLVLVWLNEYPLMRNCLEIGTGSGCIAITLAMMVPNLRITATDISPEALDIARKNAISHQVEEQILFQERDLMSGMEGQVDLIVANLPYIPTAKLETLPVYTREPILALDGGADGLSYIKKVLKGSQTHLRPGGAIFLELDEDCGTTALELAKDIWPGKTLKLSQDLSGKDRYLSIQNQS
jgi:release factor glutamine methyltransferase